MLRAFDHVHQRAEHGDQGHHGEEEHDDLLLAAAQGGEQEIGLAQVLAQLEHAEDPQHAYHPDDQQVLGVGVEQGEEAGEDRQQVDQAVEAEGIAQRLGRAVQAQQVFHQEDAGEAPFDVGQQVAVVLVDLVDAVDHHYQQAGQDHQQQRAVEAPAVAGVGLEDDDVEAFAPAVGCAHRGS